MRSSTRAWGGRILAGLAGLSILMLPAIVGAEEIVMKSGFSATGISVRVPGLNEETRRRNDAGPVPAAPFWMLDDGVRRNFIAHRQVLEILDADANRLKGDVFELEHQTIGRGGIPISIGAFAEKTEFDEYGRRLLTLNTDRGPVHIHQGITRIRPEYVTVVSTSHQWEHALDTSALPSDVLRAILNQAIDRARPQDRQAQVLFYLQAGSYSLARTEIDAIRQDFPEMGAWADEMDERLTHLRALQALGEIKHRRAAGQHQLAYTVASAFPEDRVAADVLREAQDVAAEYRQALEDRDKVLMMLGLLEARLPPKLAEQVRPLRAALKDELHYEGLERLAPFLRAENDATLAPEQKLALAYSGWVLGSTHAVTELPDAVRAWEGRFLALEYLRSNDNPPRRKKVTEQLRTLEGMSLERLSRLTRLLPLPIESPSLPPRTPVSIDVAAASAEVPVRYTVVLPPEYSPHHAYPLLIALRREGHTLEQTVGWWSGTADREGYGQRRGYIVIAPDYAEEKQAKYDPSVKVHHIVLESLKDARKRFRVDSNRVYLAGHGMGADACYDLGMSHPHEFAGVIPICGASEGYCDSYWENGALTAWYVVGGERDGAGSDRGGNKLARSAPELNQMMRHGQDVFYCEYKARGFEPYFEELPRIFEWMELHRRQTFPREWAVKTLRSTDNHFFWVTGYGFPDKLRQPIVWDAPGSRIRAMSMSGKISTGTTDYSTLHIEHPDGNTPATHTTVWLSPELVDFNQRVKVHVNRRQQRYDYVAPDVEVLLEDLRLRGDRERLYWARVDL